MDKVLQATADYFAAISGHKQVVCYGAGAKARQTIPLLRAQGIEPVALCDGNPSLWGKDFEPGLPILSRDEIRKRFPACCFVLTVASGNALAIKAQLQAVGSVCDIYHAANPFKVDDGFLPMDDVRGRIAEYRRVSALFVDMQSKALFRDFLQWKMCGNILPLFAHSSGSAQDTFFDPSLVPIRDDHVYIDVGAYTGDTIMKFLLFSCGRYQRILGFEPDTGNCTAARDFVRYSRMARIEIRNQGLWSEKGMRRFYTVGDGNAQHYDSPNFYRSVEYAADNQAREVYSSAGELFEEKFVNTLDNELGDCAPSILKVNALAADLEILQGGERIIRKNRPVIIMEYGCKREHILATPKLLLALNPDYRLYLRQKEIFGDCKTILYAIPA